MERLRHCFPQRPANFKGPERKYFRLREPYGLSQPFRSALVARKQPQCMDLNVQPNKTAEAGDGLEGAWGPGGQFAKPGLTGKAKSRTLSISRHDFCAIVGEDT